MKKNEKKVKKNLTFIENLCFCNLKIAVCVPKIPIGRMKIKITIESKNCRLKITAESKNYRVRVYVYAYTRVCMANSHRNTRSGHTTTIRTPTEHTTTGKERITSKRKKPAYICMISCAEKKYKKS